MTSIDELKALIICTFQPRYRVFDLSGAWEFAVDYYIVLGRREDISNQNLTLKVLTNESLLDLPYALKQGYLIVRDLTQGTQLEFSNLDLHSELRTLQCVIIPNRSSLGHSLKKCLKFSASIDPFGQIAANFTAGHKYRLEITDTGLTSSIKWCKFVDEMSDTSSTTASSTSSAIQGDHVSISWIKKATSKADFKALPFLTQPPQIQATLLATSPLEFTENEDLHFSVKITNRSAQAVSVLSTGLHRYMAALDLHHDTENSCQHRRITADSEELECYSFSLLNTTTKQNLIEHNEPPCVLWLDYNMPPHRDRFTTLQPHVPLIRQGSIWNLLPCYAHLEAGEEYELSIPPMGADWFWGTVEEVLGMEERWANHSWNLCLHTPPVMLASENKITFKVRASKGEVPGVSRSSGEFLECRL